ncbi:MULTISPECIES: acyltransferase family protein [Calothrix]|uniref:Acyltransferase n=2 Tax=Calothrix TaxID=1186 RepID=A0ABR8A605_9CYAN|nr:MULTISPECIES: acyltransferase [Calothrix]MBD2194920.1 acyltransferase [Calothrix parietina FACHB-288]MBD2223518.1 acyltransferase [Calothrix anomala FACHB-343]
MNKLLFIDALRGMAILGVLINHAARNIEVWGILGKNVHLTPWVYQIMAQGSRGVQLFFVASAFTLCLSYERRKNEKNPLLNFFIRRFFRIAPLFYCGFLFYTIRPVLLENKELPSFGHIFSTLTFTNGWNPYWFNAANAIVPGGWSIAVEMTFYLLFPFLFSRIRSLNQAIYVTAGSLLISRVIFFVLDSYFQINDKNLWNIFISGWFPNQLPIFFIGFIFYFIFSNFRSTSIDLDRKYLSEFITKKSFIKLLLAVSIVLLVILPFFHHKLIPISFVFGLDFLLLATCLAIYPSRLLVNRFFCFLGTISFSGYITHFYVLNLAHRALHRLHLNYLPPELYLIVLIGIALAGTIVISYFCYKFIEIPGQTLGRKLIVALEARKLWFLK